MNEGRQRPPSGRQARRLSPRSEGGAAAPVKDIVLLARPHPRIIPIMQPWLTDLGLSPFPCATAADIPRAFATGVCGAVISLSPASPVHEAACDVLATVHRYYPGLPIVFATIADPAAMLKSLRASLGRSSQALPIIRWVGEVTATNGTIGSPRMALLVHRDDLADPVRAEAAGPVVLRHFGRT